MPLLSVRDVSLAEKIVLARLNLDSPVDPATGLVVMNDRLQESAETLRFLLAQRARVVILGHQGRPGKSDFTPTEEHVRLLSAAAGCEIAYCDDLYGSRVREMITAVAPGKALMLQNARFSSEEMLERSPDEHATSHLVRGIAPLIHVYFTDAFTNFHRDHASMIGFTGVPNVVSDEALKEIQGIKKAASEAHRPFVLVLGGAKIDDYIGVMRRMLHEGRVDKILAGGMLGNLALVAQGIELGGAEERVIHQVDSLTKSSLADLLPEIQQLMREYPGVIEPPLDVAIDHDGKREEIAVADLPSVYRIKDIGSRTIARFSHLISTAETLFVKGPMGLYEEAQFATGSKEIIQALAAAQGYTLVGGGNTTNVIELYSDPAQFDHISLAGGATLALLERGTLPCIEAYEKNYERYHV